ncbi:Rieske (2Fe-2S) protein [Brachymonas sp.]|uniref:Rieske (2Fe-2S) protein n=1 Tax=Brachymonas sp. TaxID=1936292 RepID=UPI0035AF1427
MTDSVHFSRILLCSSDAIEEGGEVMPFDVVHDGEECRAFAARFEGRVSAFLNRCTHVAMELDFQPNRIFDDSGQWLLCASHGAVYHPESGECMGGPCHGGLVRLQVEEEDGQVYWIPDAHTQPSAD